MIKVYGIPNCNTVQKAISWLKDNALEYQFHDFKKLGISEEKLSEWAGQLGWEAMVNKRGTTWKKLEPSMQRSITTELSAIKLMHEKTSVIKRPIIEIESQIVAGFDMDIYKKLLL